MKKYRYQSGFGADLLFSAPARLTRASTKRSSIWTMIPGGFLTTDVAATGTCGTGGKIFSNEKAGIVHPLVVELKHSRSSPGNPLRERLASQIVFPCLTQMDKLKHNLCQIAAIAAAL
jgi:hypothetical protein